MGSFWTTRSAVITGLAISALGAFYIYQSPTSLTMSSSSAGATSEGVPGLDFKLSQVSRNPPVLLVTLKNSGSTPYTLLKWGSPLDSAALNTGVFSIVDNESGGEVEQFKMMINRKMPPAQEELVTLAPGTEEEIEVTFDKPWMPERKPAKYRVKAEGKFTGLWDRYGDAVSEDDLNAYIDSPFNGKTFTTNEVVMEVH